MKRTCCGFEVKKTCRVQVKTACSGFQVKRTCCRFHVKTTCCRFQTKKMLKLREQNLAVTHLFSNLVFLTHAVRLELALQATYTRDCNDDDGDNMTVTTTNDDDEREDDDDRRCFYSMCTMPETLPANVRCTLTPLT